MKTTRLCDIIIVNWNSGNMLERCLRSIYRGEESGFIPTTYIIDNASSDHSLDSINTNKNINVVRNSGNVGFAAACNQGIALSSSTYILFLNPDTELFDSTLIDSISFVEKNSDIHILGVKHVDRFGKTKKSCSRFPTLRGYFNDIVGLSKILPSFFKPATIMLDWNHNYSQYVDQVMGAYMLIRRSALNEIGLFDERFFVYYEDVDLSYRFSNHGKKTFYSNEFKIYHHGAATTKRHKHLRLFYSLQSRLRYAAKHFSRPQFWILLILTLFVEPFTRFVYLLFQFEFSGLIRLAKGYKLLYDSLLRNGF